MVQPKRANMKEKVAHNTAVTEFVRVRQMLEDIGCSVYSYARAYKEIMAKFNGSDMYFITA